MPWWLPLFLLVALVEWVAAGKRRYGIRVFSKPLSLILLLSGFTWQGGWQGIGIFFGLGLIFSLGGDIFLLMRPRFFIAGLVSFLFAHLAYISGFLPGRWQSSPWIFLPFLIVIMIGVFLYPRVVERVRRRLENRHLVIPVVLYMLTITSMLLTAILTWFHPRWYGWPALAASVGALLFTVSDSVLAFGKFSHPLRFSNFIVMFTYHLGQLGIVLGALMVLQLL